MEAYSLLPLDMLRDIGMSGTDCNPREVFFNEGVSSSSDNVFETYHREMVSKVGSTCKLAKITLRDSDAKNIFSMHANERSQPPGKMPRDGGVDSYAE
nr:hypothetical protein [Olegusella massiliensis]